MAQSMNVESAEHLGDRDTTSQTNLPGETRSVLGMSSRSRLPGEQLRPSPSFGAGTRTSHRGCAWLPDADDADAPGARAATHHAYEGVEHSAEAVPSLHSTRLRPVGLLVGVPEPSGRMQRTEILIIDDSTLQRENLAATLARDGTFVPSMAWDLASALAAIDESFHGIVLLNMATSDKITLLSAIGEKCPAAKVIAVGISEDDEEGIIACAEAGVAGYHLRTESLYELLSLITKVVDGESACSPRISAILLKRLSSLASQRRSGPEELALTTREMQILRMLEMGYSNRDIADQLCIALHTVKNHVHSVLGKLGVSTRAEAAALCRSSR